MQILVRLLVFGVFVFLRWRQNACPMSREITETHSPCWKNWSRSCFARQLTIISSWKHSLFILQTITYFCNSFISVWLDHEMKSDSRITYNSLYNINRILIGFVSFCSDYFLSSDVSNAGWLWTNGHTLSTNLVYCIDYFVVNFRHRKWPLIGQLLKTFSISDFNKPRDYLHRIMFTD